MEPPPLYPRWCRPWNQAFKYQQWLKIVPQKLLHIFKAWFQDTIVSCEIIWQRNEIWPSSSLILLNIAHSLIYRSTWFELNTCNVHIPMSNKFCGLGQWRANDWFFWRRQLIKYINIVLINRKWISLFLLTKFKKNFDLKENPSFDWL